jgi:Ser/Thr protein kinase RdoA (MazF antagonist)
MNKVAPIEIDWDRVINQLEPVSGGHSSAHRGIHKQPDGRKVFVKIGDDEREKTWAMREVAAYKFLAKHQYSHCPNLLAHKNDNTAFAIELLDPAEGWNWGNHWTNERLNSTLSALDDLAKIVPTDGERTWLKLSDGINNDANGWVKLFNNPQQQAYLKNHFRDPEVEVVLAKLDQQVDQSKTFIPKENVLVHYDVRADNCGWNEKTNEVKLIDWNWLQLGDRKLDLASFLTHVHQNGVAVTKVVPERLDNVALQWMAGFWLEAASKPIWINGPKTLRKKQLKSALTALSLVSGNC